MERYQYIKFKTQLKLWRESLEMYDIQFPRQITEHQRTVEKPSLITWDVLNINYSEIELLNDGKGTQEHWKPINGKC